MLAVLCGWLVGWVGPWVAFLWGQVLAPVLSWVLHCFGMVYLGERAEKWWCERRG